MDDITKISDADFKKLIASHELVKELIADDRKKTVDMLREWKRHHDIMSDPKSLHYSMCIEEILDKLEDSK